MRPSIEHTEDNSQIDMPQPVVIASSTNRRNHGPIPLLPVALRRPVFLVLPLLVLFIVGACADSGLLPVGKRAKGSTLIIGIEDIARVREIRFLGTDQTHYLVVPGDSANELVVLRLSVFNADSTRVLMTVDEEAVELRGVNSNEVYTPVNLFLPKEELLDKENVTDAQETHPAENRYTPIIAGPIELPQNNAIDGWIVFEVPKGAKLREMRWDAGDTVFIRS